MKRKKKIDPTDLGWSYWQRAQEALDSLDALMQQIAPYVTQYPPLAIPHHQVGDVRRQIDRFSERFSELVHEQKRQAVRK